MRWQSVSASCAGSNARLHSGQRAASSIDMARRKMGRGLMRVGMPERVGHACLMASAHGLGLRRQRNGLAEPAKH